VSNAGLQRLVDEAALRRTAELYAQGADRRDKALWSSILTQDCVIEAPGIRLLGREQIVAALDVMARLYVVTQHRVHNQIARIDGDTASGETYSVAEHVSESAGKRQILTWAIRYQDLWRREAGEWRFARRALILDWTEVRTL